MDPASLLGQHGRARVGEAVFFIGSGSENIFTQGEAHRRVTVEHPMDLTGVLLTPAIGVEERLVGRAEPVKAHPGGESQLGPGAIPADVEPQMIAHLDKLGRPRAGPTTLHEPVDAGAARLVVKGDQADETRIRLQRGRGLARAGFLSGRETGIERGQFVGLNEGTRAQLASVAVSAIHREGIAGAETAIPAHVRRDDFSFKNMDLGVPLGRHIHAEAGPEIDGIAVGRDHGEACRRRRHVGGEAPSDEMKPLARVKPKGRRSFDHDLGAARGEQLQRARTQGDGLAAQRFLPAPVRHPRRADDSGVGAREAVQEKHTGREQGNRGRRGEEAGRSGREKKPNGARRFHTFRLPAGREITERRIEIEPLGELTAGGGVFLEDAVETRHPLGGDRPV